MRTAVTATPPPLLRSRSLETSQSAFAVGLGKTQVVLRKVYKEAIEVPPPPPPPSSSRSRRPPPHSPASLLLRLSFSMSVSRSLCQLEKQLRILGRVFRISPLNPRLRPV